MMEDCREREGAARMMSHDVISLVQRCMISTSTSTEVQALGL